MPLKSNVGMEWQPHERKCTMTKIKASIVTEKGNLKPIARTAIAERTINDFVSPEFEVTTDANGKTVFVRSFEDADGNKVYAVLNLTVSMIHPSEKEPAKKAVKAKAEVEPIVFE